MLIFHNGATIKTYDYSSLNLYIARRANGVGQLCIVLNIGVDLGLDICIALCSAVCSTGWWVQDLLYWLV